MKTDKLNSLGAGMSVPILVATVLATLFAICQSNHSVCIAKHKELAEKVAM